MSLRNIYPVDKFLNSTEKRAFKAIYDQYTFVDSFEDNYDKVIVQRFGPFWTNNHNAHNKTFDDKEVFRSDEYLNIVQSCKAQLRNKNVAYTQLIEKLNGLSEQLVEDHGL